MYSCTPPPRAQSLLSRQSIPSGTLLQAVWRAGGPHPSGHQDAVAEDLGSGASAAGGLHLQAYYASSYLGPSLWTEASCCGPSHHAMHCLLDAGRHLCALVGRLSALTRLARLPHTVATGGRRFWHCKYCASYPACTKPPVGKLSVSMSREALLESRGKWQKANCICAQQDAIHRRMCSKSLQL